MKNTLLIIALATSLSGFAQTENESMVNAEMRQSSPTWSDEELASTLSISVAEAARVNDILQNADKVRLEARSEKKAQMKDLRAQGSELTEADIEQAQQARFTEMRQRVDQEEQTYKALRQVLSPSQIRKLEQTNRQARKEAAAQRSPGTRK